jgi:hypothetical protein
MGYYKCGLPEDSAVDDCYSDDHIPSHSNRVLPASIARRATNVVLKLRCKQVSLIASIQKEVRSGSPAQNGERTLRTHTESRTALQCMMTK